MLKFAFNLVDDGLVGQQVFAGEATRMAYMTDEAVEGRDAFLEKREPDWSRSPDTSSDFGGVHVLRDVREGVAAESQSLEFIRGVSKSPLRRLTDQVMLTSMRPPIDRAELTAGPTGSRTRGKRILITGASSGIGEASAVKLASHGRERHRGRPPRGSARRGRRRITRRRRRRAGRSTATFRPRRRRRAGRPGREGDRWRGHPDQQRGPVDPPPIGRIAGTLA